MAKNLLEKCKGPKRKPLEREYPNLCSILHPLTQLDQDKFCKNNAWDIPRKSLPNCNNRKCPMEDAILGKYIIRLDGGLKNFIRISIFKCHPVLEVI